MKNQAKERDSLTHTWPILPGRALFFLDIGAERGRHGEGDRRRIWPKLFVVAESMCMGEGEVDLLRLEWMMELQLEQFRVQTGKVLWVTLDSKKCWSGDIVPGTSKEGDLAGDDKEFVEVEEFRRFIKSPCMKFIPT